MKRTAWITSGLFIGLLLFFIWTRTWAITRTLEFFSDTGRDHYVMLRALQTAKPPLLGPSNGAMPFDQSPIYYYLNFPVFILTGASPYTTLITLTLLFVGAFALGLYLFRDDKRMLFVLGIFILLVSLQPQLIEQHRHPWNPTFTVPFLLVSVFVMMAGKLKTNKGLGVFAGGIALALGCSYSVFPTVVALLAFVVWCKKTALRRLLLALLGVHLLVFFPMLVFELRSHFMLTKRMLLEIQLHEIGSRVNYVDKVRALTSYLIDMRVGNWWAVFLVLALLLLSGVVTYRQHRTKVEQYHLWFLLLFAVSYLLTIASPFRLEPHYIFGVLTLFLLAVATMKRYLLLPLLLLLLYLWVPQLARQLTAQPHRTTAQLEACARQICAQEKQPLYAAVQAWHSYHYAPDYLFFLNKAGCFARDVTQDPGVATLMALFSDNSQYTFGKTAFMELTLFHASKLDKVYQCDGNIKAYMLTQ